MANDKLLLVSVDGHVGAQTHEYRKYIPSKFHPEFDDYLGRHKWLFSPMREEALVRPELHKVLSGSDRYDANSGTPIVWDAKHRLSAYDEDGVAAEILFPDDQNCSDPPWGAGLGGPAPQWGEAGLQAGASAYTADWVQRGAEAYNRWLVDFCAADPRRLRGLTALGTLENVDWAIAEVKRAYDDGLRTGIVLPLHYSLPLYHHPRYDPLWALLQELDLTISVHVSTGGPDWVGDDMNTVSAIWFMEYFWYAQRPVWCLILGGVMERFPRLRLVVTEGGVSWVPQLLAMMDVPSAEGSLFTRFPGSVLKMKPSDYWRRQCFVGHSADTDLQRTHLEDGFFASVPNMLWGSDMGHGEGFWPSGLARLHPFLSKQREENVRDFLGERAHRAYSGLERSELQDIIDRVGPSAEFFDLQSGDPILAPVQV